jgi:hypothetical protein
MKDSVDEDVQKRESLCIVGGNVIINTAIKENSMEVVKKKNNKLQLPYDPTTPFLGV